MLQCVVAEVDLHPVAAKVLLVLLDNRPLGGREDMKKVFLTEVVERNADGEATDELGLETVVDEVLGPNTGEKRLLLLVMLADIHGAKADILLAQALFDNLLDARKGPTHNKKNVTCVDRLLAGLATTHLEELLELTADVLWTASPHLGLFQKFQKACLDATPRNVSTHLTTSGGDLVDFVEKNKPILGELDIAFGGANKLANQIINVATHVSGLRELGDIGFDERHTNKLRNRSNQVGLTNARRAEQNDILFYVLGDSAFRIRRLAVSDFGQAAHVVVMVADSNGQGLLGVILANHIAVKVLLDLSRCQIELQSFDLARFIVLVASVGHGLVSRHLIDTKRNLEDTTAFFHLLPQELREILRKFFGIGLLLVAIAHAFSSPMVPSLAINEGPSFLSERKCGPRSTSFHVNHSRRELIYHQTLIPAGFRMYSSLELSNEKGLPGENPTTRPPAQKHC